MAATPGSPSTPKRWRPRIGLRAILIMISGCAFLSLPIAIKANRARKQQQLIVVLKEAGANVMVEWTDAVSGPTKLRFRSATAAAKPDSTQPWTRRIMGDSFVQNVVVVGFPSTATRVPTDALRELQSLRHLTIRNRVLTDEQFEGLCELRQLRVLDLFGCPLTQEDYWQLERSLPDSALLVDPDYAERSEGISHRSEIPFRSSLVPEPNVLR